MGPRHAERAFLATQNDDQSAIVKVEKLEDLAACLRREFPQHRGRPLGLAADAAPDRLNPRERYWTNATLARDEYMKMVKLYADHGVPLVPCLEAGCWSYYWDPTGKRTGVRPVGRDFFFPVCRRPQEQFDVERLLEDALGERNVTFRRSADFTATRLSGEVVDGTVIVACKSQDLDVPCIRPTLKVTQPDVDDDKKVMYMLLFPQRVLTHFGIDWPEWAFYIALSEGLGDKGRGRTGTGHCALHYLLSKHPTSPDDEGVYDVAAVFRGIVWLRDHLPPGDSLIAEYRATVACKLQKFLDDTRWRGELPEGRGLDHEVAEAIVRAVTRQERRRARPELFAYARLQWAEMVGRHDLH